MNDKQLLSILCIVASLCIFLYLGANSSDPNNVIKKFISSITGNSSNSNTSLNNINGGSEYDLSGLSFSTAGLENTPSEYLYNIQATIDLINEQRTSKGLATLTADTSIIKAALVRAEEISTAYDTIRPNGNLNESVMSDYSIPYVNFNELIDSGSTSPSSVVNVWLNNADVNNNMLSAIYEKIGVGIYKDSENTYYWTLILTN